MFLIILFLISVLSFSIGLFLGKKVKPKVRSRISLKPEDLGDYKNFLNYDGNIQ